MVFYLKVNRDIEYTYRNVKHWVEAISYCKNSKIIFICDNENITNKLKREYSNVEFILSDRTDNKLMFIVDNVCIDYWKKAGFAHLTTFNHAKKMDIIIFGISMRMILAYVFLQARCQNY